MDASALFLRLMLVWLIVAIACCRAEGDETVESPDGGGTLEEETARAAGGGGPWPVVMKLRHPAPSSGRRGVLPFLSAAQRNDRGGDRHYRRPHYPPSPPRRQYQQQHPPGFIRNVNNNAGGGGGGGPPLRRPPNPSGRTKMHLHHQYPRRPNNYAKPLQHLQLPSKSPPLPPVMMTYPSSVDHSAVGGMDPAASSGQHSSTSSPLDTQQSLLNLQLGAAEYLTYLYLPPAPQELDEQLQRDQEASSSAATSHRKPTNTHQDGTPEPSEDDQKVTPPPYAFDPYRFRSVKSTQYYPKSRLDSEADWIPIESPWPGHNYDNITE